MSLLWDIEVVGRDDRAVYLKTPGGGVLVVADGAGGTGHGARAAEAVITAVMKSPKLHDAGAWAELLRKVDSSLRRGETTAVIASIADGQVRGASVGDSQAWLVGVDGYAALTCEQSRKPLIGSGQARVVGFTANMGGGTLLLASDGLFNYAAAERITASLAGGELGGSAARLAQLVRLPSGELHDDVAVVVARER